MEVKALVERLTNSRVFKAWEVQNPNYYLVHILFMSKHVPQVGYYNKEADRMFTFEIGDTIVLNPQAEVFKKEKTIEPLDMESVMIDKPEVTSSVQKLKDEKYRHEILDTEIVILQKLQNSLIYNVTYFTKAFKTLNIKVSAESGEILNHEIASLVSF